MDKVKIFSPMFSLRFISADLTKSITTEVRKLTNPKKHLNSVAIGLVLIAVLVVAAAAVYFVYNQPKTDDGTTPTSTPSATLTPSPTATPIATPIPTRTPMPTASPSPAPTISVF